MPGFIMQAVEDRVAEGPIPRCVDDVIQLLPGKRLDRDNQPLQLVAQGGPPRRFISEAIDDATREKKLRELLAEDAAQAAEAADAGGKK